MATSPLCEKCLRRLVDCERFYREHVEQCDDFAEGSEYTDNATESTSDWLLGTVPTGAPSESQPKQQLDRPINSFSKSELKAELARRRTRTQEGDAAEHPLAYDDGNPDLERFSDQELQGELRKRFDAKKSAIIAVIGFVIYKIIMAFLGW